ncbi:MAG: hypothetical protein IPO66_08725 [Rhodanobacteraceae bacterium]|nr:hypothetical protein [Rhodanobacteraceae bacterium]
MFSRKSRAALGSLTQPAAGWAAATVLEAWHFEQSISSETGNTTEVAASCVPSASRTTRRISG